MSATKTPGQLAYEAYTAGTHSPVPWEAITQEKWERAAAAARMPLAIKVFEARQSLARLLITYRDYLQGNWYERSAQDAGMALDGLGFIKGPYKHDPIEWPSSQAELKRIVEEKA